MSKNQPVVSLKQLAKEQCLDTSSWLLPAFRYPCLIPTVLQPKYGISRCIPVMITNASRSGILVITDLAVSFSHGIIVDILIDPFCQTIIKSIRLCGSVTRGATEISSDHFSFQIGYGITLLPSQNTQEIEAWFQLLEELEKPLLF